MHLGEQVVLCLARNDLELLRQLASSPLPMAHPADTDTLALLENQGLCTRTGFPTPGWTITAAGKLLAGMEQSDSPALLTCFQNAIHSRF